jgi:hypothetical protein
VTASGVIVVNATTITATTPPHGAGLVIVRVVNPGGAAATLVNAFSYEAGP